ncbi:MAG: hypothetical protein IJD60_08850 [Clostridia bacterium]|nr:hypothetical protein [Clostridia bacterium]
MDWNQIRDNLLRVFSQLMAMRVIVTSPREKVADLPALYVILAVAMAPWVLAAALALGLLRRYAVRFERDAVKI